MLIPCLCVDSCPLPRGQSMQILESKIEFHLPRPRNAFLKRMQARPESRDPGDYTGQITFRHLEPTEQDPGRMCPPGALGAFRIISSFNMY